MVQTSLHAQISAANHYNLSIATSRASNGVTSSISHPHQVLGTLASNFEGNNHNNNQTSSHAQHYGSSSLNNGISTNIYSSSNHLQNQHHLTYNRNRQLSAAAVASLNSHFTHSHFISNNIQQNSHHQLSLSSNSSSMSPTSSSSSPSASISPPSLTLSNSNIGTVGFHQSGNSNQFHSSTNHVTDNSHHSSSQQQQQQNTSRYKTELCRPFEENGTCKYGEKCQFAHGLSELRTLTRHPKYKTEFCRTFHTTGFCPYGPRCHFIHNSKTPPTQAQLGLNSYAKIPFGHQTSHSASPSTSPISSTSSATTTNGSLSSADSSVSSSSPPSSSRLMDISGANYPYRSLGMSNIGSNAPDSFVTSKDGNVNGSRKAGDGDNSHLSNCAGDSQRLFWLHSHMNEGSRWPPAMCASELIGSNNARRTWQMQA